MKKTLSVLFALLVTFFTVYAVAESNYDRLMTLLTNAFGAPTSSLEYGSGTQTDLSVGIYNSSNPDRPYVTLSGVDDTGKHHYNFWYIDNTAEDRIAAAKTALNVCENFDDFSTEENSLTISCTLSESAGKFSAGDQENASSLAETIRFYIQSEENSVPSETPAPDSGFSKTEVTAAPKPQGTATPRVFVAPTPKPAYTAAPPTHGTATPKVFISPTPKPAYTAAPPTHGTATPKTFVSPTPKPAYTAAPQTHGTATPKAFIRSTPKPQASSASVAGNIETQQEIPVESSVSIIEYGFARQDNLGSYTRYGNILDSNEAEDANLGTPLFYITFKNTASVSVELRLCIKGGKKYNVSWNKTLAIPANSTYTLYGSGCKTAELYAGNWSVDVSGRKTVRFGLYAN